MKEFTGDEPRDGEEKSDQCDSCQFETTALHRYVGARGFAEKQDAAWLCTLCWSTMTGTAHAYPEQYRESGVVLKTICYVGNTILAAIKEKKDAPAI